MQNAETMRERMFTMRLNEEEAARLERVAAKYGLNAANLIRHLLKKEEDAITRETLDEDLLFDRAVSAMARGLRGAEIFEQPSRGSSGVEGDEFVLRGRGLLARFKILPGGKLRRIRDEK